MKIEILRNSDENDKIISKQQDEALYIYVISQSSQLHINNRIFPTIS